MRGIVLVWLAACGRIGFGSNDPAVPDDEPPDDAATLGDVAPLDAADDATVPAAGCRWTDIIELRALSSPLNDWEPAVSPDGQTLLLIRESDIYRAMRTSDGWTTPVLVPLPSAIQRGP